MGTNQNEEKTEYEIERRLKCAYGWDGDQILKALEGSEKEISESDLPSSGKYNFERLLRDIEERKIAPQSQEEGEETKAMTLVECAGNKTQTSVSLRYAVTVIRTSIAAVAAASLVLFIGMSSLV